MLARLGRHLRSAFDAIEAESRAETATSDPLASQRRVAVVLVTAGLSLTFIHYLQGSGPLVGLAEATTPEFARLTRWTAVNLVGYLVIPWVVVRFVLKERVGEFGLTRHAPGGWRPYSVLLVASLPFVVWAATLPSFQSTYPFYRLEPTESPWPWLVAWWALYAAQFVGVEAFFRGFLVHGTRARFGAGSVFVMMVPYLMIHFGKPAPEALSAILGGVVLGFLSLTTRSIWWGVALHVAIALVMDVTVLVRAGVL